MHINFIINSLLSQIFCFKICTKCLIYAYFIYGMWYFMYDVYTVKLGDTIEGISEIYNTDINELISLNGIIDLSNLKVGMKIIVPNDDKNPYRYYTVKKGDTLDVLADRYNIDYKLLVKLNGLEEDDYIYPNQILIFPKVGVSLYLTKRDDTISSVMESVGMNIYELIENNQDIYLREEQIIVY